MAVVETSGIIKHKNSNGDMTFFYPVTLKDNVSGMEEIDAHISNANNPHNVTAAQIGAVSSVPVTATGDGTAYTATVDGITELAAGVNFTMIPDTESTSQSVTLNVNGLGAKLLRRRVSAGSSVTASGYNNDWLAAGKPVRVMYDGLFWTVDITQAHASDLMGSVPINKGGTGATDGSTGLANLLAAGDTVLSAYQYGTALPAAGTLGRVFFKKVTDGETLSGGETSNLEPLVFTGAVNATYDGTSTTTVNIPSGGSTSGGSLSESARNLLITILRNGVYISDQSANITALETALGGSGTSTPTDPDTPTYTISNELVNVTSNNSAASIAEGSSYTATLTANDGYTLGSVTVTMGGVDVTSDVYADGVINIASVTGNVEITASAIAEEVAAVLPENGLLAFWDLRNATSTTDWAPTIGDATAYKLQSENTWDAQTVDTHGVLLNNTTYGGAKIQKVNGTGTFTDMELGTAFTIVTLGYSPNAGAMIGTNYGRDGFGNWYLQANYTTAEGTTAKARSVQTGVSADEGTYCPEIYLVDGTAMSLYLYGTQWLDEDGSSYNDFDHWADGPYNIRSIKNHPSAYLTAVAIYDRALSDVEIVEIGEYLRTLEVTA